MKLALGNSTGKGNLPVAGIVTSDLKLLHKYDAGAVVPISDGAVYLDGDEYVQINGLTGDLTTDEAFSCSAWFRSLDTGHAGGNNEHKEVIFSCHDSTDSWANILVVSVNVNNDGDNQGGIMVKQEGSPTNNISVYSDGSSATNGTKYFNDGLWHHIAVTNASGAETTTTKVYVDGLELTNCYNLTGGSDSAVSDIQWSDGDLYSIGQEWDGSPTATDFFKGYICNVGVWNTELTHSQIKSIMGKNYAGLSTSEKTNLVSWWNLDVGYDENYHSNVLYGTAFDNHHGGSSTSFGPEMVSNGDFSNGTTGWFVQDDESVTYSVVNPGLELKTISDGIDYGHVTTEVNFFPAKTYKIELDIIQADNSSGNGIRYVRIGASDDQYDNGTGVHDAYYGNGDNAGSDSEQGHNLQIGTNVFYYRHSGNGTYLVIGARNDVQSLIIDNVSVKEVLGNTGQTL